MDNQSAPYLGMDPNHQQKILKNAENLVDATDYNTLMNACLRAKLLNRAMYNKIEAVSDGQRERHRRLFSKLTKRGPDAFQTLKNIFVENNYTAALKLLTGDDNYKSLKQGRTVPPSPAAISNSVQVVVKDTTNTHTEGACISKVDGNDDENEDFILQPYDKEIQPKKAHEVIKSTHIHQKNDDDKLGVYPMKSQHNRGVFLMINIIDFVKKSDYRKGAKEDSESLLYLFKALGFTLFAFENLRSDNFKKCINKVINSEYVRTAECFVMALMTHGTDEGHRVEKVELSDGTVIKVEEILSCFYNDVCSNLINKPKIFLFPFCRGVNHDSGHTVKTQADSVGNKPQNSIQLEKEQRVKDILICYATLPGHKAYRDIEDGSWYIQCFCENMAKHAHDTHFENVLKLIQDDNSKKRSEYGTMQTANYNNIDFNKKLYFNPGVYEEVDKSG